MLIPGGTDGGPATCLLKVEQISFPRAVLVSLIEGEDSRGPVLELMRKDRLRPVDEEEGCFAGRLGRCRADRP
jgi:hypothetical protein